MCATVGPLGRILAYTGESLRHGLADAPLSQPMLALEVLLMFKTLNKISQQSVPLIDDKWTSDCVLLPNKWVANDQAGDDHCPDPCMPYQTSISLTDNNIYLVAGEKETKYLRTRMNWIIIKWLNHDS